MLQKELLRGWLADAYGAEVALMELLQRQLIDLSGQHEMEDRIVRYIEQSHRHANMLQESITRLEGETSSLNYGGLPALLSSLQGLWSKPASSMLVKHVVVDTAALRFQLARVHTLISAANGIGDAEVETTCREIVRETQEMADWLCDHLPRLVQQLTGTLDGGEDLSHEQQAKFDAAGALQKRHLYAVVDDEPAARKVEKALTTEGRQSERLAGRAAATTLTEEAQGPGGTLHKMMHSLKSSPGETQHAEHYATHVENGRIVLAVPCRDRDTAEKLIGTIKEHGGYDFAYFSDGSIETVE
jgi:ferritin-like metal-binding protein YciE